MAQVQLPDHGRVIQLTSAAGTNLVLTADGTTVGIPDDCLRSAVGAGCAVVSDPPGAAASASKSRRKAPVSAASS